MILKRISILNYKNLEEVELGFSAKLNCFVGLNGMGKTNLLDAVRLFCGIPAARMAFVAAAFSFSLLCCLPLERFCVDAQLARPDCDWQLLQRYTWQSSELDEYITQQAGENANLSE